MNEAARTWLRNLLIAAGAVVIVAGLLSFRLEDWPVYVAFFVVSMALVLPHVQVLPGLALAIPDMAATIGFLYIGGLPIVTIRILVPVVIRPLHRLMPERWESRWRAQWRLLVHSSADPALRDAFWHGWGSEMGAAALAEWGLFSVGLGVRWLVASALTRAARPLEPDVITVAEFAGYAAWGLLSLLPVYPDRPLLRVPAERRGVSAALSDMGFVVALAATPFVFLITYGYRTDGASGAAAWALASLGLHFMLRRLNERRLTVEEQNRRLETLNRELEHRERLSAIGKMSSVVSHQILHQLGVIGIYADLIRSADGEAAPEGALARARENAGAIEAALRDVNRILTDLLVFSKDLRLNLYEHSLARLVAETVEECRVEAGGHGVELLWRCPEDLGVVVDKLKIKQALGNVLRNAIDVAPPGSEVSVVAERKDGAVQLSVSDRGPGIPEHDHEAVFAPFFTTKEHGTGLGLAIAREFTEAHGGALTVAPSSPGGGATFVFWLPLDRTDAPRRETEPR
ncbi:MAG: sensor histidine kinase [Candidatus Binatia bacterium]